MDRCPFYRPDVGRLKPQSLPLALVLLLAAASLLPSEALAQERGKTGRDVMITALPLASGSAVNTIQVPAEKVSMQHEKIQPKVDMSLALPKSSDPVIFAKEVTRVFLKPVNTKKTAQPEQPGVLRKGSRG